MSKVGIAKAFAAVVVAVFGASLIAWGITETSHPPEPKQDPRQQALFLKRHPCPAGKKQAGCPGYVVAYVKPLCAGGADRWTNMHWQTVAEARKKEREAQKLCKGKRS